MTEAPTFEDIFTVMSLASVGDKRARVTVPDSPHLDDTATKLALALNILLDDLTLTAMEKERELAKHGRLETRLQTLADASREFSAATGDLHHLLDVVARRVGEEVGDLCVIRTVTDDGEWLEPGGAGYHADPELVAMMHNVALAGRQRVGERVRQVISTTQPLLIPKTDTPTFATTTDPSYAPFLERFSVASSLTVALMCRGKVVGIASLLRSGADHPYDEYDARFVQSLADHAALAIANARSYAAERAARDAAEKATARFTRLNEAGIIGTVVIDLDDRRLVDINETLLHLVGHSRDELVSGRVPWRSLTAPEWSDVDTQAIEQLTASGVAGLREKEYLRKDGVGVPVLVGSAMLGGGTRECISFVLDLTERKEAERGRREAERRAQRMIESATVGIWTVGADGRTTFMNARMADILGRDLAEAVTLPTTEFFFAEDRPAMAERLAKRRGGLAGPFEQRFRRPDGAEGVLSMDSSPLYDAEGRYEGVLGIATDITDRRRAEEALRTSEVRYKRMVETANQGIWIVDLDGRTTFANGKMAQMLACSVDELTGMSPLEFLDEPGRVRFGEHLESHREGRSKQSEILFRAKDGSERWTIVDSSPVLDASGRQNGSFAAVIDVTQRRIAEEALRVAAMVDSSDDAIIGMTFEGIVTSWNAGAHRLFGYAAEEMIGRSISLLVPPGRENEEPEILKELASGHVQRFDTVRLRKDGREIDVSVTGSPVRDAAGILIGASKVVRDITERRRAEVALARAKDATESANRELEAFSYSVAHDLRAPLRGMNGFAQILLDTYGDKLDAKGQDWLREIRLNAEKMADLIDGLLSLARLSRSDLKVESVDLSAIVREAVARLHSAEPDRAVDITVEDGLRADVDVRLAKALFENLLANAWKFASKVPSARIEVGATDKDGTPVFHVRDNGAGFDMAFANKLFAPFQRLHTVDEFPGSGIGLATVQRIVHRHGGRVWAEGVVDGGATFYFTFPSHALAVRT
jgi:PAS domain S-box-containing protein